ncbi:MAG: acyl-[acyl-carrier-protein]--UDP-N-acetylglucosamine O-acyltransferase, partial [Burkholderiales bacterium]|nr:acyl-[acyl-carrier-protein]--UDP-N-acetylglucosamine O-acyltransferase [Burkholderiales bacterium]
VGSVVLADVPPFVMAMGNTARPFGVNSEGLKRRDFSADVVSEIRRAYKTLYRSGFKLEEARIAISQQAERCSELAVLSEFLA